jgi:hypothetical protein
MRRLFQRNVSQTDSIISEHFSVRTQALQVLHKVPSETVVVVENEDHV